MLGIDLVTRNRGILERDQAAHNRLSRWREIPPYSEWAALSIERALHRKS
jgi:hypothetical protein